MQQAQKRAQWVYVQASASASGVDEVPNDAKGSATMKYIALYRVFKPDVSWPETTPRPPPVDTRAAEAAVGEAAGEAAGEDLSELIAAHIRGELIAAHIRGEHLAQCPEWLLQPERGDELSLHLAAHEAEVVATMRAVSAVAADPLKAAAPEPEPESKPTPPHSPAPDMRQRRYKCVSRAALTVSKEPPSMDTNTGKPLQGQIVGLLEVGDVVTVFESDLDFSSAGVPRLHVRDRGGWVSVCAQDGTELLEQLAPQWGPAGTSSAGDLAAAGGGSMSLDGPGGVNVSRDSYEESRSSLDVHLDPLGQGAPPSPEHTTPPPPEPEQQQKGLYASVVSLRPFSISRFVHSFGVWSLISVEIWRQSSGRYRAMFDFEPEEATDLKLTRGGVILLLNKTHAHWWEGANETAPTQVGMFPFNYVQPLMVVRAGRPLPSGEEICVSLPPELCPLAPDGTVQAGYTLQVLLPHGAEAGQEIEFPLPVDWDISRIDTGAAGDGSTEITDEMMMAAQKFGGLAGGVTKGGNQVPQAPPPVLWRTETQRRRELENEKAEIYKKIEGQLAQALSETDAKSLVRQPCCISAWRAAALQLPALCCSPARSDGSLSHVAVGVSENRRPTLC